MYDQFFFWGGGGRGGGWEEGNIERCLNGVVEGWGLIKESLLKQP